MVECLFWAKKQQYTKNIYTTYLDLRCVTDPLTTQGFFCPLCLKPSAEFFLLLKGGGLFLVNTMASLTHWPLSPAVKSTTSHYNRTRVSVRWDLHNDSAMEFFWPFFPLLLALRIPTTHSAPDFSCKCFWFLSSLYQENKMQIGSFTAENCRQRKPL